MAYVHVGHDSVIGNNCILVNNAALAGHVIIDDWVTLGGFTLVHQFTRIGAYSFCGMGTAVGKDIPAYVMISGNPAAAKAINTEGLKRRGFSAEAIKALKKAYKAVYRQGLTLGEAYPILDELSEQHSEVQVFIDSIRNSQRGIVR